MGLKNHAKDIQLHLSRMFHVSVDSSYKFLKRHPIFSCLLLLFSILYIFLSYIYTFLGYMSPFLICGAIFLRIFWSSEKTQLRYVKLEEKKEEQEVKVEPKILPPKIPIPNIVGRQEQILFRYPSQNATSRRRNFRERKWDVYGGLEEKAKDLSEVFQNEYTNKRNTGPFKRAESSLYYGLSSGRRTHQAVKRSLRSEPSMVDLIEVGDTEMEIEKMEDEEDGEEDVKNTIEWTENDQKNLMDVGDSEMERNRRLESLIARRRARKLLKLQVENGLVDKKAMAPSSMKPLVVNRESCDMDDLEMPGSAPSVMPRSPYDIPYEPFEEKPNLTSGGFLNDFQKDVLFSRHESFSLGSSYSSEMKHEYGTRESHSFHGRKSSDKHGFSRFRRLPDKGNHDWLIEQLIYNDGAENGVQAPKPLIKGEETKLENDEKSKTDIDDTKTISVQTSESASTVPNISKMETNSVSQKPGSGMASRFSKSHERLLNIPVTFNDTKTIHESMCDSVPSPIDKRQETMFSGDRRLCHTPTFSIASDMQVEVSEVGSPTSTVDDNGDSNSSSDRDRDSMLYDGDIDRDVSSGSEDLWGASFHGKGGVKTEENNNSEDVNNGLKDIASPNSLRQIDEEDVADVSSYSSRDEGPEDTPTCCVVNSDHNVFGNYTKFSRGKHEVPQSSRSSYDTLSQNQLIGSPMDQISEEISINQSHVIDDVNNLATTEQGNRENSTSSEDPGNSPPVVRQESLDEGSNESISSSPRSVLPDKTVSDEISSPSFNQQMDIGSPRSIIDDMTQEALNEDEHLHDSMTQNVQNLVDEITDDSHNADFNHFQEQTNNMESSNEESNIHSNLNGEEINMESSMEESNIHRNMNGDEINMESSMEESNIQRNMNDEEINRKEQRDEINNGESSEENSSHQISHEATSESTKEINMMETMDEEESRDLADDKVPSTEVVEEDKNEPLALANDNINDEFPQPQVIDPMVRDKETIEGHMEDS
ncbi:uncharacterized protein LOC131630301 isoform X2 [Vicia villosa]|uniref:uncharacterized protein LOC131630301 isoform X2 n=1 Tax=Vicia villosa TaxID=3911 RepID=UPI00273B6303|nr:uncharacterized protein LOC131630301 isoform X2 [Vicia villosa]